MMMKVRRDRIVPLVLAVLAVAGAVGEAAPASSAPADVAAEVTGQVKDSTGAVIVGASVTLRATTGNFVRDTATDARGRYRFQGVPPGGYVLVATRDGFSPASQEVAVASSGATVDLVLSPATFSEEITVSFIESHSSALKADAPVRDIPLSVQSYTSSFIKAIETPHV